MKNTPTQKVKGVKKEGKESKAKIANLSPEDIKGIAGGQPCGGKR